MGGGRAVASNARDLRFESFFIHHKYNFISLNAYQPTYGGRNEKSAVSIYWCEIICQIAIQLELWRQTAWIPSDGVE